MKMSFFQQALEALEGLGMERPTPVALITGRIPLCGDAPTFISPPLWDGRAGLVPSLPR